MIGEEEYANIVRFDRHFTSKLRCLILRDDPRIPKALMDKPHNFIVSHNWGDIILYSVSTVIRIYGFKGTPHVLPYQVPLKVGVAEFLQ